MYTDFQGTHNFQAKAGVDDETTQDNHCGVDGIGADGFVNGEACVINSCHHHSAGERGECHSRLRIC